MQANASFGSPSDTTCAMILSQTPRHRPAAEAQVGMVPVPQFRRDRSPFGTVVEAPDDRLDRAPFLLARAGPPQLDRGDRQFEFGPLGVGQYLHRLPPIILAEKPDSSPIRQVLKC